MSETVKDVQKLVYTVQEAAIALGVSTKTIRRFLQRGVLTSSSVCRRKLIPRRQVEAMLKATTPEPFSPLLAR
jgi:excisionase family DNA binding protein